MPDSAPAPAPVVIPDHELLRPIGRGSYGEVWLARSVLGELRAVKLVRHSGAADMGPAGREFDGLRKFEPVSRSHPGLVHILHAGRFTEGFYYVMELADSVGGSGVSGLASRENSPDPISQTLDPLNYSPRTLRSELQHRGRLPVAECLDLALKLTDALAHLHGHGLVHRDLKPSNIIFVGGQPKLADIGLVASADASMSCVGTEGYLPPEGPGKPPADLFALGKVLYELATGRDRTDFPELPTLLREDSQREALEEFNEVILKACDPDLHRRYQSAAQMRADLLLMQSGQSLRGARALRRRLVFARRAGALVGLAALLAVAAYFYQQLQTREAKRLAQAEATQRGRAEALVSTLQLKEAERLFEKDDGNQGVAYLARMLRQNPSNQLAAARMMSALNDRSFALPIRVFEFPEMIEDLEFSPDGSRFITWTRGGTNHLARLWDVAAGRILGQPMDHAAGWIIPRFSPDGRWLATVSTNNAVHLLHAANGEATGVILAHDEGLSDLRFSPDSQRLVVASGNKAHVWNVSSGERAITPLDSGSSRVGFSLFSPDGGKILTTAFGPEIHLWDAKTGRHLMNLDLGGLDSVGIGGVQFSPDGNFMAAALNAELWVWEARSGRLLHRLGHDAAIKEMDFSPEGLRLVTGDGQRWARVWDAQTGQPLIQPIRHGMDLWAAQFDPTGERMLTRERGRARLWDSRTGRPLTEWIGNTWRAHFSRDGRYLLTHEHHLGVLRDLRPGRAFNLVLHHRNGISEASFSASGRWVVVASGGDAFGRWRGEVKDDEAAIWNSLSGELAAPKIPMPGGVQSVEFSPDEATVLTASNNGRVQLLNARTGRTVVPPMQHSAGVDSARFSQDGKMIATAAWDHTALIWDARTGRRLTDSLTVSNGVEDVEFSPDENRLLVLGNEESDSAWIWNLARQEWVTLTGTGGARLKAAHFSPDGTRVVGARLGSAAGIWGVSTGPLVGSLRHQGSVWDARYSPNGKRIVTASTDQTARVWDAVTFQPIGEPMPHAGLVAKAVFSPDSRRVITVSTADHASRIWDAETGQPLTELLRHDDWATVGEFSPDGSRVLTASMDGTVRIWELPPTEMLVPGWLLELAEAVAGHRLLEHETPEPVSAKEFLALRERILASETADPCTIWAKWFLSDRGERAVSFSSSVMAKDHLTRLLEWSSVATLREAIHFAPDHAEAHARLAREILTNNPPEYPHLERASAFLAERAAWLAPDTLQTWWARAEMLARTNQLAEALTALSRAFVHAPDSPELWRRKAQWLEQSGQLEAALPAYAKAIALLGSDPQTAVGFPRAANTFKETRLMQAKLLERLGRRDEAVAERLNTLGIPARDPATPYQLLDLSEHYNLSFLSPTHPWAEWRQEENLATLSKGDHFLAGVRFDLRGAILAGDSTVPAEKRHLAGRVHGIRVRQHCHRLHFLHVIHYDGQQGIAAGRYVVHFEDGSQAQIPIIHDKSIGYWSGGTGDGQRDLVRAWAGTDEPTPARASAGHLYRFGWSNPKPHLRIETMDLEPPQAAAGAGLQAMLLVAITAQTELTPEITQQPRRQTMKLGEPATFQVGVRSEAPLSYQWQLNGMDLPGATNAILSIPQATHANVGGYTVQVRNRVTDPVLVVTSDQAALAIQDGGLTVGLLQREVFTNLPGEKLPGLTNSARFPNRPDLVDFIPQLETPSDIMDSYGVRLTGYLVPPKTGEYRFFLSSDDEGVLFLSSDESPVLKRVIAHESLSARRAWNARHQRPRQENISPPIQFEAGRRYFFEALMKEGPGADHLAVTWQMPGEPPPENGSPPIAGIYLAVPAEWIKAQP